MYYCDADRCRIVLIDGLRPREMILRNRIDTSITSIFRPPAIHDQVLIYARDFAEVNILALFSS